MTIEERAEEIAYVSQALNAVKAAIAEVDKSGMFDFTLLPKEEREAFTAAMRAHAREELIRLRERITQQLKGLVK